MAIFATQGKRWSTSFALNWGMAAQLAGALVGLTGVPAARAADPNLVTYSAQVNRLINDHAASLSSTQANQIYLLLNKVQETVGHDLPAPPAAVAAKAPGFCAYGEAVEMQDALKQVRDFAYSNRGLNLDPDHAADYARRWVGSYPCAAVGPFLREGYKIAAMAASPRALALGAQNVGPFAVQALDHRCAANVDYLGEAQRYFDFACSPALSLRPALCADYARRNMQTKFFSCGKLIDAN